MALRPRSFAMWVTESSVVGRGVVCSGPAFGPAPAAGQPLAVRSAFAADERVNFRAVLPVQRGGADGRISVLVSVEPTISAGLRGALLHEEGVHVRVFSATLDAPWPRVTRATGIVSVGDDDAPALIQLDGRNLCVAVVGSSLSSRSLLPEANITIQLPTGDQLKRADLDGGWRIRPLHHDGDLWLLREAGLVDTHRIGTLRTSAGTRGLRLIGAHANGYAHAMADGPLAGDEPVVLAANAA